jgi:hypothetical protein
MAKRAKDYLEADFLIKGGRNLSEPDAEYDTDRLTR